MYNESTAIPGTYSGIINAGPQKLLQFLEAHLGLTGNFPALQERLLKLKEGLEKLKNNPGFHFKASFGNNPIGVSKRLLNLWDNWRMAGWSPDTEGSAPP